MAASSLSIATASSSALVVVAGEMKKPVHHKVREMMCKGFALGARFALRGLVGDHDITEQPACSTTGVRFLGRKGQHIGHGVFRPPRAVEGPDRCVIG